MSNPFGKVSTAGNMNSFSERLEVGDHLIAVETLEYKMVHNKKINDKVGMVACESVILESTSHKPGERRSDAWMIGNPGTSGESNRKRCNQFGQALTESIGGDATDTAQVQTNLSKLTEFDENTGVSKTAGRKFPGRGIVLRVSVTERKGNDGKLYKNNVYSAVKQTAEQIKTVRARIETIAPVAAPAATPAPAPAAPAASTGMLDDLGL